MSSFRGEIRPLIGHNVTVATECGSITGHLVQVGIDKIVVRTSTAKFIIRIRKICWVRRAATSHFSPCHHHQHHPVPRPCGQEFIW